jgi:cytochrome b
MVGCVLVWDIPTRVFHGLLVACFGLAWLSAESERLRDIHVLSSYLLLALIGFRLVWGLIGSRYARFAEFVRGPSAVSAYLRGLMQGHPPTYTGHNPAGALAIVALLGLGVASGITGWLAFNEMGGEVVAELHETVANAMLALVFLHILAVVISSRLHGENLVKAMLTGYKSGASGMGIRRAHGGVALVLVTGLAAFGWALIQGKLPALWDPLSASVVGKSHEEG